MEDLRALASSWWAGDGTTLAFARVFEIGRRHHEQVADLIAALAAMAPSGALPYIGTSIVEDLAFQVEDGKLPGIDALQLVLDAGLSPSQLFEVFSGAYASYLHTLDELSGAPFTSTQSEWLLDDRAPHRWEASGRMLIEGDGLVFVPGQTPWQAELERRYPVP